MTGTWADRSMTSVWKVASVTSRDMARCLQLVGVRPQGVRVTISTQVPSPT